jgi:hypothetical protein
LHAQFKDIATRLTEEASEREKAATDWLTQADQMKNINGTIIDGSAGAEESPAEEAAEEAEAEAEVTEPAEEEAPAEEAPAEEAPAEEAPAEEAPAEAEAPAPAA